MDFDELDKFDLDDLSDLVPDRGELETEEMFAQADRLLNDSLLMEAIEKLSQIIKRNPRFGKAYNHLGWIYETKYRDMARAEKYYKAAMLYAPQYTAAYLNYSYFLSNLQRFDDLKAHLDKVSQIPGIAKDTIANEYAIMYELQGNIEQAIDRYQEAAIITLDITKLEKYKESIERCQKKLDLLSSSRIM